MILVAFKSKYSYFSWWLWLVTYVWNPDSAEAARNSVISIRGATVFVFEVLGVWCVGSKREEGSLHFLIIQRLRDWLKTKPRAMISRFKDARGFTCTLSIRQSPVTQNYDAKHVSVVSNIVSSLKKKSVKSWKLHYFIFKWVLLLTYEDHLQLYLYRLTIFALLEVGKVERQMHYLTYKFLSCLFVFLNRIFCWFELYFQSSDKSEINSGADWIKTNTGINGSLKGIKENGIRVGFFSNLQWYVWHLLR